MRNCAPNSSACCAPTSALAIFSNARRPPSPRQWPQSCTVNRHPRQFGAWRVLRQIGVGGMGEVWLGERSDGEFEQRVAIKQVAYPTPGLLHRFRQERQILARLAHPNIARLIDGGVDADGTPYLVMEYVEGVPITAYVRDHALELGGRGCNCSCASAAPCSTRTRT